MQTLCILCMLHTFFADFMHVFCGLYAYLMLIFGLSYPYFELLCRHWAKLLCRHWAKRIHVLSSFYANFVQALCRLCTDFMRALCWLYANYAYFMQTLFRVYADLIRILYRFYVDFIQTLCRFTRISLCKIKPHFSADLCRFMHIICRL